MGENSKIEWTHHTFNPWWGCTKVSEGCANCYAERDSKRNPLVLGVWGSQGHRMVASPAKWAELLKLDRLAGQKGVRERVFCASFADVFEEWTGAMSYPAQEEGETYPAAMWHRDDLGLVKAGETTIGYVRGDRVATMQDVRLKLFAYIAKCRNLDFQLLTKRPAAMRAFFETADIHNQIELATDRYFPGMGHPSFAGKHRLPQFPWPNVWLGVSVENQAAADERIPELLKIPAAVRFLSCEPLLGPVDLGQHLRPHCPWGCGPISNSLVCSNCEWCGDDTCRIHWVIAGGESGPHARPCHPYWIRGLRDQCKAAGVPFFFKQWGEWGAVHHPIGGPADRAINGQIDCRYGEWHSDGLFVEDCLCGDGSGTVARVGKKLAGRMLDGREWSEFPEASA